MPNPMPADRLRNSAAHRAALAADLADWTPGPTGITRTHVEDGRHTITVDDGHDTAIVVESLEVGRLTLTVTTDDTTVAVDLSLSAAARVDEAIRAVAGSLIVAPIGGSR